MRLHAALARQLKLLRSDLTALCMQSQRPVTLAVLACRCASVWLPGLALRLKIRRHIAQENASRPAFSRCAVGFPSRGAARPWTMPSAKVALRIPLPNKARATHSHSGFKPSSSRRSLTASSRRDLPRSDARSLDVAVPTVGVEPSIRSQFTCQGLLSPGKGGTNQYSAGLSGELPPYDSAQGYFDRIYFNSAKAKLSVTRK